MKRILFLLFLIIPTLMNAFTQKTLHDFKVRNLEGQDFDLAGLKGKKVLVVNTASKCGLTPQYTELQKLFEEYGGSGFTIIGFPANNFLRQEPGTNEEIREFCTLNYGVSFPMMEKISVKGKDIHPVYKWLTRKDENGKMDSKVSWNFQKYMVNEDGSLEGMVSPKTGPYNKKIIDWIER